MTAQIAKLLPTVAFIFLFGCQDDEQVTQSEQSVSIAGYVQKGPFINGTAITVSELDQKLVATGKNFTTQIIDNKGSFSLKDVKLQSDFVQLIAEGFYFDEVHGEKSAAQLTLFALADVSDASSVNVNLLSHLEKDRVIYLMQEEEKSFATAKQQAQREILTIFGIEKADMMASELLDISQDGEDNAILLAISAILQGNNSVAELSELLADIITDIREDGVLDSESTREKIRANAIALKLTDIRQHLEVRYEELGVDAIIPNFEQYVDSDGDGFLNKDEDDTPDDFVFEPQVDVAINDTLISNAVTISGLKEGSTAHASVADGWLVVNGSVTPVSASGTDHRDTLSAAEVKNGNKLQIQLISSSQYAEPEKASLTIGTLVRNFRAVTDDYLPDEFSFSSQENVALETYYTSDTITISGIPHATPVSVGNATLIKNGKKTASNSTLVVNGDQIALSLLSSDAYTTSATATLTINRMSANFIVTTDDYAPDTFSFTPIKNAKPTTTYTSEAITLSGLRYPALAKVNGGILFINNVKISELGGIVETGDQVVLSLLSGQEYEITTKATLSIGSFITDFTVQTYSNPIQEKAEFPAKIDYGGSSFNIGKYIYAIGNSFDDNDTSNDNQFFRYDTETEIWEQLSDFPGTPRKSAVSFAINEKGYISR